MSAVRERLVQEAASRGKYAPLYRRLLAAAGPNWRVSFSELEAETLVFERTQASTGSAKDTVQSGGRIARRRKFDLDTLWPAIAGGSWPPGFTVSREQIYDDSGRLTGGPQGQPEGGCGV